MLHLCAQLFNVVLLCPHLPFLKNHQDISSIKVDQSFSLTFSSITPNHTFSTSQSVRFTEIVLTDVDLAGQTAVRGRSNKEAVAMTASVVCR